MKKIYRNAIIAANYIDATQIRIANLVKEIEQRVDRYPVCKIDNNMIVVK